MSKLKSTEIATALTSAMAERRLVRPARRCGEGILSGYVVGIAPAFVMIAVVDHKIWFDGFSCVRRSDITAVEDDPSAEFLEAALARRGEVLPAAPPISLASVEELLKSADAAFRMITIHTEAVDPDVCYVGRVHDIADGEVALREVTPSAKWETELCFHPTADITRVDFGGDYESALSLVAGEPPEVA